MHAHTSHARWSTGRAYIHQHRPPASFCARFQGLFAPVLGLLPPIATCTCAWVAISPTCVKMPDIANECVPNLNYGRYQLTFCHSVLFCTATTHNLLIALVVVQTTFLGHSCQSKHNGALDACPGCSPRKGSTAGLGTQGLGRNATSWLQAASSEEQYMQKDAPQQVLPECLIILMMLCVGCLLGPRSFAV